MKSQLILSGLLIVVAATASVQGLMADEPYEANWQSLQRYECPEWFRDAKFGIYAHWGVYSAARGSGNTDWYSRNMYKNGHPSHVEHEANYGPVSKFGYKDLVPLFKAEKFNADAWVDLFVEAGARFAGPVGEHSDGFAMWDSEVNPWNAVDKGPNRDVVGEMETAVRKRGLKFLVSMHHQWLWGWYPTWDHNTDASDPRYASLYGPLQPPTARGKYRAAGGFENMYANPLPSPKFQTVWLQKVKEVVSKNGCLLLNIAPHPDGSIPVEQQERLRGIGKWLRLNGEAIYGSRPWLKYGEGPTKTPVGHLADLAFDGFSSRDIRFTTKGSILYAIALGWPGSGKLTIGELSLAKYSTEINDVRLVGHDGQLQWKRTFQGLEITLPSQRPCDHAYVFKVLRVDNKLHGGPGEEP